ncbi:MAG: sugar phosphate isomerase/epimerase, partial [Anaerolineae bacterium]|nr:sugar phosphate isomerase/epimerase [Anaerolineae bacterium]
MFDLSCHTWGFSDQPLEQAVQTIARLGFNNVDLGSGPHIDTDTAAKEPVEEAARIRKLLDRFHLNVIDLYLLLPALASADEGRRQYEVRLFTRLVPFAIALGAPGITLSPGIAPPQMADTAIHKPEPRHDDPEEEGEAPAA